MRSAFTLIELLVVIAIIALLASMTLVVVNLVRNSAWNVHCQSNLRQLAVAQFGYAQDFEDIVAGLPTVDGNESRINIIAFEPYPVIEATGAWHNLTGLGLLHTYLVGSSTAPIDTYFCKRSRLYTKKQAQANYTNVGGNDYKSFGSYCPRVAYTSQGSGGAMQWNGLPGIATCQIKLSSINRSNRVLISDLIRGGTDPNVGQHFQQPYTFDIKDVVGHWRGTQATFNVVYGDGHVGSVVDRVFTGYPNRSLAETAAIGGGSPGDGELSEAFFIMDSLTAGFTDIYQGTCNKDIWLAP
jgi:prepilin-type N-terminal cleavage/methylation domain-containing protein/prepilin-type processing-associated H-X9-DG protein